MSNKLGDVFEQTFPAIQWHGFRTLIAVSGGPDSVALLRLMVSSATPQTKSNLIVVHINHATRAEQSDADAEFVKELAQQHQLEFCLESIQPQPTIPHGTASPTSKTTTNLVGHSEESLRNARYDLLVKMAAQQGCRYLVTGHHLDDQIETVLFRIFRGTGIAGLQGIPKRRVVNEALTIVRPLLAIRSHELKDYLRSIGQDFRTDPTNAESSFTRNFLRNEILPSLEQRFGDVTAAVSRLSQHAQQTEAFIDSSVEPLLASILKQTDIEVRLDRRQLIDQPGVLLQKLLLKIWSNNQWPLQSISAQWWQRLTEAITNKQTHSLTLNVPGPVRFSIEEQQVILLRS